MSKYIDADLLRKEVEKRMHICDGVFERDSDTYYQGKAVAYQETLSFIDSLQQEQLCAPVDGEVHHVLNCHYIATEETQLCARLREFPEGAKVDIFIIAKED